MLKASNSSLPWRDPDGKLRSVMIMYSCKNILMFSVMLIKLIELNWNSDSEIEKYVIAKNFIDLHKINDL